MTTWHHMIDLETIDTAPTAGILSIGIVAFNPDTGEIGPALYRRLGYDQALQFGTQSDSTIQWWQKQSEAARTEAFTGQHDALDDAIYQAQYISAMWQGLTRRAVVQLPTVCTFANDYYDAEEIHTAIKAAGVEFKRHVPHQFIQTGDADVIPGILDHHGDVVLAFCRVCKQAEGDLAASCPGAPTV